MLGKSLAAGAGVQLENMLATELEPGKSTDSRCCVDQQQGRMRHSGSATSENQVQATGRRVIRDQAKISNIKAETSETEAKSRGMPGVAAGRVQAESGAGAGQQQISNTVIDTQILQARNRPNNTDTGPSAV